MEQIKGKILDNYLSKGFYRWYRTIFTDNSYYDSINNKYFDVFWLRTNLSKLGNLKTHSIYKKNKKFSVSIHDSFIDGEIEELYQRYKANLNFEPSETVNICLNGSQEIVPLAEFHTKSIQIRDGNKLIAASYFDIGKLSMMDITNFYDPTYKKYSLSKYMMLLKMEYGLVKEMQFYYPGYIALNNTIFDYKLFPTEEVMEVYIPDEDQWYPFQKFGKEGLIPHSYLAKFSYEFFMKAIDSEE